VNIRLILSICLLTLPEINIEYLSTVHLHLQGRADPHLALVFEPCAGFFGHTFEQLRSGAQRDRAAGPSFGLHHRPDRAPFCIVGFC
jgi:hypothetical protein